MNINSSIISKSSNLYDPKELKVQNHPLDISPRVHLWHIFSSPLSQKKLKASLVYLKVKLDPGADREHLHGGQTAFVNGIDVGGGFVHHSVALERKTVGFYDRNKNHH